MNIVYPSETYLDSSVPVDNDNPQIPGYSSVRADQGGVVLVYCKSYLSLKLMDVKYLLECISFNLRIRRNICKFLSLYRLPSQSRDESETFLLNLELSIGHMADKPVYDNCSWRF